MAQRTKDRNAAPSETRITTSEASKSFGELLDRAADGEVLVVTRFERERVVILSRRDYDRLLELAGLKPTSVAAVG